MATRWSGGGAVRGVSGATGRGRGACRSTRAVAGVSDGPAAAGRAQERGADGGEDRSRGTCGARHQSMHHFVAKARRGTRTAVLRVARDYALAQLERHAPVGAWVVDDTGMPKKGRHSVGVARQYCGPLGKQDNCQVAVTVSLANAVMSVPARYRLYLPEAWAKDRRRCRAAAVPTDGEVSEEVGDRAGADRRVARRRSAACAGGGRCRLWRGDGVSRGADRPAPLLRRWASARRSRVWPPGQQPLPAPQWSGQGRPPNTVAPQRRRIARSRSSIWRRSSRQKAWAVVRWREGTKGTMSSRFARLRVRPAHRDYWRAAPRDPEWLVDRVADRRAGTNEVLALERPRDRRRSTSSCGWSRSAGGSSATTRS